MFSRLSVLFMGAALIGFGAVLSDGDIYGDIFNPSGRSISLTPGRFGNNKCPKEVPAVLFRTEKGEQIKGNGSNIFWHQIEDCCDGYKRTKYDWNRCEPVCGLKCKNGFCRTPGRCECFDGFIANDRGECVFACPLGCENGRCFLNGTCLCDRGYTLDPSKTFCRPICKVACGLNEICGGPNKCDCKEGYQSTTFGCQPICTPDCGHGRCVAPNQCECFPGFAMTRRRNVCEADSNMRCENGFSDSRYRCVCFDGYRYDENTTSCLPYCGDKCEDGVCKMPGVCECFEGYQSKESTCVPVCPNGCGYYGVCISPNICGCAISNQRCIFGSCDAVGRCICSDDQTHFVNRCVKPNRIETLMNGYDQRQIYNDQLKLEFHNLIGRHFSNLYAF